MSAQDHAQDHGRHLLTKLKVHAGPEHPHHAPAVKPLSLGTGKKAEKAATKSRGPWTTLSVWRCASSRACP